MYTFHARNIYHWLPNCSRNSVYKFKLLTLRNRSNKPFQIGGSMDQIMGLDLCAFQIRNIYRWLPNCSRNSVSMFKLLTKLRNRSSKPFQIGGSMDQNMGFDLCAFHARNISHWLPNCSRNSVYKSHLLTLETGLANLFRLAAVWTKIWASICVHISD